MKLEKNSTIYEEQKSLDQIQEQVVIPQSQEELLEAKVETVEKLADTIDDISPAELAEIEKLGGDENELVEELTTVDQEVERTKSGFIDRAKNYAVDLATMVASVGNVGASNKQIEKIKIPEPEYNKKDKAYRDSLYLSDYSKLLLEAVKNKNFKQTFIELKRDAESEDSPYANLLSQEKIKPLTYKTGTIIESGSVWNKKTKQREPYKNSSINYKIPVYKAPVFDPKTKYAPQKGFWKTINEKIENSKIVDKWKWKTSEGTIPVANLEHWQEKQSFLEDKMSKVYEYFAGKPKTFTPNEPASFNENKDNALAKKVAGVKSKTETKSIVKKVLKPEELLNNKKQTPEIKSSVKKVITPEKKTSKTESKIIYVEDKNDPRLKAYQDSLRTYNDYNKYIDSQVAILKNSKTGAEYTSKLEALEMSKNSKFKINYKLNTIPENYYQTHSEPIAYKRGVDSEGNFLKNGQENNTNIAVFKSYNFKKPTVEVKIKPKNPKLSEVKLNPKDVLKIPPEESNANPLANIQKKEIIKAPEKTGYTVRTGSKLYYLSKEDVDKLEADKTNHYNVTEKGDGSEKHLVTYQIFGSGSSLQQVTERLGIKLPVAFDTQEQKFDTE
jgi:hypothetical protein